MAEYTIHGPDAALLGMADVRKILGGVSLRQVRALIAAGQFPRPIRAGDKGPPQWTGLTIAAWQHLAPMLSVGEEAVKGDDDDDG